MSKKQKFLTVLCLILLLITAVLPCGAVSQNCKLTVKTEDANKQAINGISVSLCKIADINGTDYYPASDFENSGISVSGIVNDPSCQNAKSVLNFVIQNNLSFLSAVSDNGSAVFQNLETGIWLVFCKQEQTAYFDPYFVFLPYEQNGELCFELLSTPKTVPNTPNNKSIYVVKKWNDQNDKARKRPKDITVELKNGGKTVDTAVLNQAGGWSHTFSGLEDLGKYTVEEKSVSGYSVSYNGDSENGFIITNTYNGEKLPQTGQLWWPIVLIAVAGVGFIILGIIEIKGKKDEK